MAGRFRMTDKRLHTIRTALHRAYDERMSYVEAAGREDPFGAKAYAEAQSYDKLLQEMFDIRARAITEAEHFASMPSVSIHSSQLSKP